MLDITRSRVTLIENISGSKSYQLDTPGHETRLFRRIVGGAGWPSRGAPGYLVVVAEANEIDFEYDARHFYRIYESGEWNGVALMTWENILEAMKFLSASFGVSPWFCLPCPSREALIDFNRKNAQAKKNVLRLRHFNDPDFETFLSTVYKKTTSIKTLHFGPSNIATRLNALTRDISKEQFRDHPEITALVMAVNGLEYTSPQGAPKRSGPKIADKVGGY